MRKIKTKTHAKKVHVRAYLHVIFRRIRVDPYCNIIVSDVG